MWGTEINGNFAEKKLRCADASMVVLTPGESLDLSALGRSRSSTRAAAAALVTKAVWTEADAPTDERKKRKLS